MITDKKIEIVAQLQIIDGKEKNAKMLYYKLNSSLILQNPNL